MWPLARSPVLGGDCVHMSGERGREGGSGEIHVEQEEDSGLAGWSHFCKEDWKEVKEEGGNGGGEGRKKKYGLHERDKTAAYCCRRDESHDPGETVVPAIGISSIRSPFITTNVWNYKFPSCTEMTIAPGTLTSRRGAQSAHPPSSSLLYRDGNLF